MAYFPGSYNAARPVYRGVLRENRFPRYVCTHADHENFAKARECAGVAHRMIKQDNTLPAGWVPWSPETNYAS